jgi:hypothetical protein
MSPENSTVIVTAILALAGVIITAIIKLVPSKSGRPLEFWLEHFERHHAAIAVVNTSINSLVDGAVSAENMINKLVTTVDRLEKVAAQIENTVHDHATRITRLEIGER